MLYLNRTVCILFEGVATLLAVTILSIPQLDSQNVSRILEWVFLTILPSYCLGQGFVDFYSNYEFANICKPVLPLCLLPVKNPCCKGTCLNKFQLIMWRFLLLNVFPLVLILYGIKYKITSVCSRSDDQVHYISHML